MLSRCAAQRELACGSGVCANTASSLLPASVVRRTKQPYRAPEINSFFDLSKGRFRHEYVEDLLSAARVAEYGVFSPAAVQRLVAKIKARQATSVRDGMALVGILP